MDMESGLDAWKPTYTRPKHVKSDWRQHQVGEHHNHQPNNDDLRKIRKLIKNQVNDADILQSFGIPAETLIAIKKGNYSSTEGIGYDTEEKIVRKFKLHDKKISEIHDALAYLCKCLGFDEAAQKEFNKIIGKKPKKTIVEDEDDNDKDEEE